MRRSGKRRSGPWYEEERERILFERDAARYFPTLRRTRTNLDGQGPGLLYGVDVDVPHYETRHVEIFFAARAAGNLPIILADGPTDSPHRFGEFNRRSLCIWWQKDSRELRWAREDGLLHLLGLVKLHLFREAWWRETGRGEWLGPEAPHGGTGSEQ
jgi:hypothetical protein